MSFDFPADILSRRRSSLLRPSLSKSKSQSGTILGKPLGNPLPPFTFGAGSNGKTLPDLSLDDCFEDSPPQERKVFASPGTGFPRRPRQAPRVGSCGSPMQGLAKRSAEPSGRPRKQFRRTLSMFEHPGDVIKEKTEQAPLAPLGSIMDVDEEGPKLPHFLPADSQDSLPRITQDTMVLVLSGTYSHMYDEIKVIDCRFEYEFNGGHITGAKNYNDKELLGRELFAPTARALMLPTHKHTLIVLHCEYSVHRAPLM
jgi:M-phase inducer tyrosine phosphatase